MNSRLLTVDNECQPGEVRLVDGLREMCLGERRYGGGCGPIWARPGETVEFAVVDSSWGYFVGICQAIHPSRKSLTLLIVKGNTWGDFKTGSTVELIAERIGRYHAVNRDVEVDLRDLAQEAEARTYASRAFKDITLQELEEAFRTELETLSKKLLGEKAFGQSRKFFQAYLAFIQSLRDSRGDVQHQPSKKVLGAASRVRSTLGLEGKNLNTANQDLIPFDLTESKSAGYGAVIGALVGDAAGGVLEFLGRRPTRNDVDRALNMPGGGVFGLAPGQITDDGELTLCLLRALAERGGVYDPHLVASYYIEWADSRPFDIGSATTNALRLHDCEMDPPELRVRKAAAANNMGSKANGALMRITPLAVASAKWTVESAVHWARVDAAMTHPHATCQAVNAAYVLAVRYLVLQPGDSDGAFDAAYNYLKDERNEALEWLDEAIDGDLPPAHPQAGFVRLAFTYAFHHLQKRSSFRSALADTLLRGGDTDTNACIVGGLIGAYRGAFKLLASEASRRMIYPVLMCDPSLGQDRPHELHASSSIARMAHIF
jgi:ADP-ribosyl-[dinitrogen reductase] hydrolase